MRITELSDRNLAQERQAQEQEMTRMLLEKDIAHKQQQLEEAAKLEKALTDLERTHAELKRTQLQLVQSEKMASMGMLVAGVAHEINTPVGAIASMHNTLMRAMEKLKDVLGKGRGTDVELPEEVSRTMSIISEANRVIESGCERVTTIVRRLRSFARLDEAELKSVDIREGLEDTLTIAHHELKHDIEVVRDFRDIPPIACYPQPTEPGVPQPHHERPAGNPG